MTPQLLDLSLASPQENLALDEALLLLGEEAGERGRSRGCLRFWESSVHFVVLGVSSRLREDVEIERCHRDGIPVLRRVSGGGTVLQGPGCLNFTLVLPLAGGPLEDISESYASIVNRIRSGLQLEGSALRGTCDLALGDLKFGGSAQKRKRHVLLHQGTILYDFDLTLIPRYLREPIKRPDYRGERRHDEFITNVPLDADTIRERVAAVWKARPPAEPWKMPDLQPLIDARYDRHSWTERF